MVYQIGHSVLGLIVQLILLGRNKPKRVIWEKKSILVIFRPNIYIYIYIYIQKCYDDISCVWQATSHEVKRWYEVIPISCVWQRYSLKLILKSLKRKRRNLRHAFILSCFGLAIAMLLLTKFEPRKGQKFSIDF